MNHASRRVASRYEFVKGKTRTLRDATHRDATHRDATHRDARIDSSSIPAYVERSVRRVEPIKLLELNM